MGGSGRSGCGCSACWGGRRSPHARAFAFRYDILYKQAVGSETVYFGMGDKDPSSLSCEGMVVKFELPGEQLKDIDLDVTDERITISAVKQCVDGRKGGCGRLRRSRASAPPPRPRSKMKLFLPHKVRSKAGKAKWVKDKSVLEVTLPIVREDRFA